MTALPITYPWEARAPQALATAVRHRWEITYDPDGINVPGEVVSATVVYDESWSPHVQASLTCRLPDSATLTALDPRSGCRLVISAGYSYPDEDTGGTYAETGGSTVNPGWVRPLADLGVTRRTVRRPQGDLLLTAQSDEILAQQLHWFAGGMPAGPVYNAAGAISNLVRAVTGKFPALTDPAVAEVGRTDTEWDTTTYLPDESIGSQSYWSLIESLADTWDLWVYDVGGLSLDGDVGGNGWRIGFRPSKASTSAAQLRTGPGGLLVSSESTTSRDDGFANTVHLIHEWTNAAGTRFRRATGRSVTSGPLSITAAGRYMLSVTRDAPITTNGVRRAAESLVRRTVTRGRSYTLLAPAMYWVRPGRTVTVRLPTGAQERHLVSRVEFSYPAGLMTLTTRLPESVTIGGSD